MFANEMVLENRSTESRTVSVTKREIDVASVKRVTLDRLDLDWEPAQGRLTFQADVPPRQSSTIRVEYIDRLGESDSRESANYKVRVSARRYMSEIRDDYVCRSDTLNACAGRVLRLLR